MWEAHAHDNISDYNASENLGFFYFFLLVNVNKKHTEKAHDAT